MELAVTILSGLTAVVLGANMVFDYFRNAKLEARVEALELNAAFRDLPAAVGIVYPNGEIVEATVADPTTPA